MKLTKQQWNAGYTQKDLLKKQENKFAFIVALIVAVPMMLFFITAINQR